MVPLCISCVMWIRLTTPFLHLLCNVYYIDNSLKTSSNIYLNIILGTQDFMSCFEWIDIYLLNSFKIFERTFIWSTICTMRCSIGYKGFKYSNYLGCYFNNRMFNRDSCGLWWLATLHTFFYNYRFFQSPFELSKIQPFFIFTSFYRFHWFNYES